MNTQRLAEIDYQAAQPGPACIGRFTGRTWWHAARCWAIALLAGTACQIAALAAETGRETFAGQMCVRPLQAAPKAADCGAVEIVKESGNQLAVRISDIVYRLQLHASHLDMVLMHGAMQIDELITAYDWQDKTLHFDDADKGMRYEIHFDKPTAPASR